MVRRWRQDMVPRFTTSHNLRARLPIVAKQGRQSATAERGARERSRAVRLLPARLFGGSASSRRTNAPDSSSNKDTGGGFEDLRWRLVASAMRMESSGNGGAPAARGGRGGRTPKSAGCTRVEVADPGLAGLTPHAGSTCCASVRPYAKRSARPASRRFHVEPDARSGQDTCRVAVTSVRQADM
jgi:hypothetical protein